MNRRQVLAAIGAGAIGSISGCLGSGGTGSQHVRITDVRSGPPPDLAVEPTVSIEEDEATADDPARLSVTWRNISDASLRLGESGGVLFESTRSEDEGAFLLLSESFSDDATALEDCWKVFTRELDGSGGFGYERLEPGDVHTGTPGLYANGDGCLESRSYRFTTGVVVIRDGERYEGDWSIEVTVEQTG